MVVAVLCLIGQGLPLLDMLLVRHARCEVHGEMIHVGEVDTTHVGEVDTTYVGEVDTTHALIASPTDPGTSSIRPSEKHAGDGEYDHCQVLSDRRDGTCDRVTILSAVPSRADDIEQQHLSTPASILRLYRLAPKLSPPTAA